MSMAGDHRSLPVPEALEGERVDAAMARLFGLSRTRAAQLIAEVEPAVGEADLDGQPRPRPSVAIGEDRVGAHVVAGLTDARSLEEVGDVQVVVVELGRHPRLGRHGACLPGGLTRLRRRAHRRR